MTSEHHAYDELYAYAMTRGRETFLLQHVVDAFAAQRAEADAKPIRVAFALVGLYLHVEKGFTGLQVQQVHMRLARTKRGWPKLVLPEARGSVTAREVLAAAPGIERDAAVDRWCASVWEACSMHRDSVIQVLREHGVL